MPGIHDNALAFWRIYPQFLRDIFTRAFTDGDARPAPRARARERVARRDGALARRDLLLPALLARKLLRRPRRSKARGGDPGLCWSCAAELRLPPRIRIGKSVVMLNHDTQLFPHHVDDERLYDFSRPVAAVAAHPTNPNVWGLKNLSQDKWVISTAGRRGQGRGAGPQRHARGRHQNPVRQGGRRNQGVSPDYPPFFASLRLCVRLSLPNKSLTQRRKDAKEEFSNRL